MYDKNTHHLSNCIYTCISDNLNAICRGEANKYTNLADHLRAKVSHKLFKNNLSKWTRCYCTVCKDYTLVIKKPNYSGILVRCTKELATGE